MCFTVCFSVCLCTTCSVKSMHEFKNGSDHAVVASYSELYEEGEVEHINCVWPVFLLKTAKLVAN